MFEGKMCFFYSNKTLQTDRGETATSTSNVTFHLQRRLGPVITLVSICTLTIFTQTLSFSMYHKSVKLYHFCGLILTVVVFFNCFANQTMGYNQIPYAPFCQVIWLLQNVLLLLIIIPVSMFTCLCFVP